MTGEPETERKSCSMTLESMREHRPREKEDRESLMYSDDQLWQLMEILNALCCRGTLVQLLRGAIMSENQTVCSGKDRDWSELLV